MIRIGRVLLLLSFVLLTSCKPDGAMPQGNEAFAIPIAAAPVIESRNGFLKLDLVATRDSKSNHPGFLYKGNFKAPTLAVYPGDKLEVTLHNKLGISGLTPNRINLHFHGLNVSPNAPADDVLNLLAAPSETIDYRFTIPRSQPPGLYWYHPHSHGEAYWQVTSGMSGAIIVRSRTKSTIPQRLLILRDEQVVPNIMWIPRYARKGTWKMEKQLAMKLGLHALSPNDPDDAGSASACTPEHQLRVTVEGTDNGVIRVRGQTLIRALNASAGRIFDLEVPGQKVGLVARDGYPVSLYPGTPETLWLTHIVLPPGGRADFLLSPPSEHDILRSRCYDGGPGGDLNPPVTIARIEPSKGWTAVSDQATPTAPTARPLPRPTRERVIVLTEDPDAFYVNGRAFEMRTMQPLFVARSGTVEKWLILNKTDEVHAFHTHQIHFAALADAASLAGYRVWTDTLLVPPRKLMGKQSIPGRATILVDFRGPDVRGIFPIHCHMLDHEDGGMMALIRVI